MSQNTFEVRGTSEFQPLSRNTAHRVLSDWGAKRDQLVTSREQPADGVTK
jgi:hypothetical protein